MEEKTLTTVFSQSTGELREELSKKFLPKDYAEIQKTINQHIIHLLAGDNVFKNSLNASDAELLHAALRMALSFQQLSLSDSIDFKALSVKTEYDIDKKENGDAANDVIENTISLLPTVICAFINPWLSLAVGGGTVLVKKIVKTRSGKHKEVIVREKRTDVSRKIYDEEVDAIITGIRNICQEIDGIIDKIQRDRKDIVAQLQDKLDNSSFEKMYPQILNSIQYLAKENMEGERKNQNIEDIIFSIQGYGYEVVEFNHSTSGFFTKKLNPNVAEDTMYLPAIVKDVEGTKVVVAQGVVYVPANAQ